MGAGESWLYELSSDTCSVVQLHTRVCIHISKMSHLSPFCLHLFNRCSLGAYYVPALSGFPGVQHFGAYYVCLASLGPMGQ